MVQKDKALETSPLEGEPSPSPLSGEAGAEAPAESGEERVLCVEPDGHRKFISGVVEGKGLGIQRSIDHVYAPDTGQDAE